MKYYQELNEVLFSWDRCLQNGLQSKNSVPTFCLKGEKLESKLSDLEQFISTFEYCISDMKDLIINNLFFFL